MHHQHFQQPANQSHFQPLQQYNNYSTHPSQQQWPQQPAPIHNPVQLGIYMPMPHQQSVQQPQQHIRDPQGRPMPILAPQLPHKQFFPPPPNNGSPNSMLPMNTINNMSDYGNGPVVGAASKSDNIRVGVRIRPANSSERARGDKMLVTAVGDGQTLQIEIPGDATPKSFTFDFCMDTPTTQEEMFETCGVKELIDLSIHGYSTTVFTYGQTGSGKTFTMSGPEDLPQNGDIESVNFINPGIVPRSAQYIFECINQVRAQDPNVNYTVRACYLEIYNEQVNDLLNVSSVNLPVRWSNKKGFFVENLFIVSCETVEDLISVMAEGVSNRKVGSHALNKDSSRSHSIFTVYLDAEVFDAETNRSYTRYGKIHFVDLAGSERLKETKSTGETAMETGHINKSLLTLGKVISILADPKKAPNTFVPYRDSKLTKLLMDSLGGASKTLMIACVTPASFHIEETLNTLKYASRTKNIRNKPVVQLDPQEQLLAQLRDEIRQLRAENSALRSGNMQAMGNSSNILGGGLQALAPLQQPVAAQALPPLQPSVNANANSNANASASVSVNPLKPPSPALAPVVPRQPSPLNQIALRSGVSSSASSENKIAAAPPLNIRLSNPLHPQGPRRLQSVVVPATRNKLPLESQQQQDPSNTDKIKVVENERLKSVIVQHDRQPSNVVSPTAASVVDAFSPVTKHNNNNNNNDNSNGIRIPAFLRNQHQQQQQQEDKTSLLSARPSSYPRQQLERRYHPQMSPELATALAERDRMRDELKSLRMILQKTQERLHRFEQKADSDMMLGGGGGGGSDLIESFMSSSASSSLSSSPSFSSSTDYVRRSLFEKLKRENEDLQAETRRIQAENVELIKALQSLKSLFARRGDADNNAQNIMDNLQRLHSALSEKEKIIASQKQELELLRQQQGNSSATSRSNVNDNNNNNNEVEQQEVKRTLRKLETENKYLKRLFAEHGLQLPPSAPNSRPSTANRNVSTPTTTITITTNNDNDNNSSSSSSNNNNSGNHSKIIASNARMEEGEEAKEEEAHHHNHNQEQEQEQEHMQCQLESTSEENSDVPLPLLPLPESAGSNRIMSSSGSNNSNDPHDTDSENNNDNNMESSTHGGDGAEEDNNFDNGPEPEEEEEEQHNDIDEGIPFQQEENDGGEDQDDADVAARQSVYTFEPVTTEGEEEKEEGQQSEMEPEVSLEEDAASDDEQQQQQQRHKQEEEEAGEAKESEPLLQENDEEQEEEGQQQQQKQQQPDIDDIDDDDDGDNNNN